MIFRVYALWNQSRRILYILFSLYVPQIIIPLTLLGIYGNPSSLSGMFYMYQVIIL